MMEPKNVEEFLQGYKKAVTFKAHPGHEVIASYLHREVSALVATSIAKHLAFCDECAAFANAYRAEEVNLTGEDPLTGEVIDEE